MYLILSANFTDQNIRNMVNRTILKTGQLIFTHQKEFTKRSYVSSILISNPAQPLNFWLVCFTCEDIWFQNVPATKASMWGMISIDSFYEETVLGEFWSKLETELPNSSCEGDEELIKYEIQKHLQCKFRFNRQFLHDGEGSQASS